jgi:hypothetical protein
MNEMNLLSIPEEAIISKIYLIRGVKVMLDQDLAKLYGVYTHRLNEQVKRNPGRFPSDFMFQLNQEEFQNLISQNAISSWGGRRKPPFAFTEHGVLMLASVLNSERAIHVNIQIVRIFAKMRDILITHQEFIERFRQIEMKLDDHDDKILLISEYLRQLEKEKQQRDEQADRRRIGFQKDGQN